MRHVCIACSREEEGAATAWTELWNVYRDYADRPMYTGLCSQGCSAAYRLDSDAVWEGFWERSALNHSPSA